MELEGLKGGKRMFSCSRIGHSGKGHTGYLTFGISC